MASIRKHKRSQFWIGCFTKPNGKRTTRSTKVPVGASTADERKDHKELAFEIVTKRERAGRKARRQSNQAKHEATKAPHHPKICRKMQDNGDQFGAVPRPFSAFFRSESPLGQRAPTRKDAHLGEPASPGRKRPKDPKKTKADAKNITKHRIERTNKTTKGINHK